MSATPPTYEMTAKSALEALNIIDAARDLITAHLALGHPSDHHIGPQERASIPVELTLSLDLTGLLASINTPAAA